MAFLVGQQGAGFANAGVQSSGGDSTWVDDVSSSGTGYVAVASGTASSVWVNISAWSTATALKIAVYSSARALLGVSDPFTTSDTGLVSKPISCSIVSGNAYFLVAIPNSGYVDLVAGNSAFAGGASQALTSYASPPSTLPAAVTTIGREAVIWLDGGSSPVPRMLLQGVG